MSQIVEACCIFPLIPPFRWLNTGVSDCRVREQIHVDIATAVKELMARYADEVAKQMTDDDLRRLLRVPGIL